MIKNQPQCDGDNHDNRDQNLDEMTFALLGLPSAVRPGKSCFLSVLQYANQHHYC